MGAAASGSAGFAEEGGAGVDALITVLGASSSAGAGGRSSSEIWRTFLSTLLAGLSSCAIHGLPQGFILFLFTLYKNNSFIFVKWQGFLHIHQ
jgi:hypothetical protein